MKKETIVRITTHGLAAILGGFLVTLYQGAPGLVKEQAQLYRTYQDSVEIDQKLIDAWREKKTHHRDSTGGFISLRDAKAMYKAYLKWGVLQGQPHAFSIGTNRLRKMLDQIDIQNEIMDGNGDTNTIEAVRIYLLRRMTNNSPHLDIMLVPAKRNTTLFMQMDTATLTDEKMELLNTNLIVNTSAPCPNMCQ